MARLVANVLESMHQPKQLNYLCMYVCMVTSLNFK